jgi:hypothetical protein
MSKEQFETYKNLIESNESLSNSDKAYLLTNLASGLVPLVPDSDCCGDCGWKLNEHGNCAACAWPCLE